MSSLTCSVISVRACSGNAEVREVTCAAMALGSAKNPYRDTTAIKAGNRARKAKNATPAPRSGTWSALASLKPRLATCSQPRAGIWVGFSA